MGRLSWTSRRYFLIRSCRSGACGSLRLTCADCVFCTLDTPVLRIRGRSSAFCPLLLERRARTLREYEGYDDGGMEYELPAGYEVAQGNDEQPHIYDPNGNPCDIVTHSSGRPQLVSTSNHHPVLLEA